MMPRSSRHKSSKHSSRDAREYSDSEKDSSLKDRKSKEESGVVRVSKDSGSTEKRKLDLKDGKDSYGGSGNGDYSEDLVSSKRRKERVDYGGSDRWNGGEDDHRGSGEGSKKSSKASGESKSKKRDESVELYAEGAEVKKSTSSSGKGEGKHRDRDRDRDRDKDSIRKEGKEGGGAEKEREREKEKKGKDGRTERLVSGDEQRVPTKQVNEKTDSNARNELESPESENQMERRMRKRRDEFGDGDKHLDDVEDINDGRLSSRDDFGRDGRQKDEKRKDDRYREKYREDMDRDNKHRDDKQRDERPTKDQPSSKSDDKHLREEKDMTETQPKRSKLQDGERKGEHDRDRDRNRDRDSYHARDRDRYHDREREHGWDHGRDRERDYDRDWDWDRERDGDRERDRNHDRDRDRGRERDRDGDRDRDRDYDRDYDGSHLDDRSTRYRDSSRGKKRSPDDRDDCSDTKSRGIKARYSDLEKKSSSGDRVESDVNKGRSQSRQAYADAILSSNKRRTSPSSNSHVGMDEYRYLNPDDLKYRDSVAEQRTKAIPPRDGSGLSGVSERGSKYRSMEKPIKMDDGHLGELSNEKCASSKASPLALVERSPSSSNIDRRYTNRTGVRRSLDIEETGRRSSASIDNRDFSNTEDRLSRDLPSEKPLVDDSSPADSSAHNRSSQSNLSLFPHPNFRAGVDSPSFVGSLEEDGRVNSNARYRRSSDPNLVRGHGNAWRGVPNWTAPLPNGFMHFQHGAPHGGFQGMLPQFPAPPIFGVRPSMEINHSGIPYHISDADRFSSHLRPLGWQNMMDGSGPSHLHLWDGNNGAFRDETHMYGGAEWDQNRHPMNARGWESSADTWKVHNNDVKRDLPSPAQKDDYPVQALVDDAVAGQAGQISHHEDNLDHGVLAKTVETRSIVTSPPKESMSKLGHEKSPVCSKSPSDDVPCLSHYYLSKLDISPDLAHPELYSQCMSILDTDGSSTVDEDATTLTILKGARAGLGSSKTFSTSSLFPPLKDSVFQKAMNFYKKQRMEIRGLPFIAGGTLDIILGSNQENMEAKVPCCDVEKVEELVPTYDAEMTDAPLSSLDEKNVVTASTDSAEEKPEVPVSTPSPEVQNDICLVSPKLEMRVEDYSGSNAGEPQTFLNGVEMDYSSELVKLEVGDANGFSSIDNLVLATSTLPAAGNDLNVISKTEDDNSIHYPKEGAADAITGPLVIPEGSPKAKACEALMSGSNESDSVILSRIHHSPESTH